LLAEALLLSDQIIINVHGPNLELPLLVEIFGYRQFCDLLEKGALGFSFSPGNFTYLTQKNLDVLKISGEPGLRKITGVDQAWSNPFDASVLTLKEQTVLSRQDRRFLARLVHKHTQILPEEIFDEAIRLANADRASALGKKIALPDMGVLNSKNIQKHLALASHNLSYLSMCLSNCNDILSDELAYEVLANRTTIKQSHSTTTQIVSKILEFESIPNIRQLVSTNQLTLNQVLDIRKTNNLKEFREWLKQVPDNSSSIDVIRRYTSSVENKLSNKIVYKTAKIVVLGIVGGAIGSIGGPLGTLAGSMGLNIALGFTDTFFIDQVFNGWNPKIFIEKEIKKNIFQ
jgi:hypothetical protein